MVSHHAHKIPLNGSWSDAAIAILNSGGIRAPIERGTCSIGYFLLLFFLDKCSIHQTATKKFSSIKCTTCFWKDSIKQTCYQVMRFLKKIKNKLIFCFLVLVYTKPDLLDVALHHNRQMEFRIYLKWKINLAGYTKPPLHTKNQRYYDINKLVTQNVHYCINRFWIILPVGLSFRRFH